LRATPSIGRVIGRIDCASHIDRRAPRLIRRATFRARRAAALLAAEVIVLAGEVSVLAAEVAGARNAPAPPPGTIR